MLEAIGGRKFIFGLLLLVAGFIFAILKMVDVHEFFTFAEVIGATYVIGNVGSGIVDSVGGKTNPPTQS